MSHDTRPNTPLKPEARAALHAVFCRQRIFGTSPEAKDDGLSIVTCRRGKGEYTVCVINNTWEQRPFTLTSFAGKILACQELPTDVSERTAIGFTPPQIRNLKIGADTATTIAAAGVRMFRVKTDESNAVVEIPYAAPTPNAGKRTLYLRGTASIKEQVLTRPTFFRHYDSVMVDARYLLSRDRRELESQRDWLCKQGLGVWVDLSPVLNLYPDYRLIENDANETPRSASAFKDVLEKMEILKSKDLLIALHRVPENNITGAEADRQMETVVRRLCRDAAVKGISVYLRQSPQRRIGNLSSLPAWISRVHEPNFKPAPSLAAMSLLEGRNPAKIAKAIERFGTDVWLVAGAAEDINGNLASLHMPVASQKLLKDLVPAVDAIKRKNVRIVYDAIYPDADAEYRDAKLFE